MGKCAEGDCDKPAGYEVFVDDEPEMFCEEHARSVYASWPFDSDQVLQPEGPPS